MIDNNLQSLQMLQHIISDAGNLVSHLPKYFSNNSIDFNILREKYGQIDFSEYIREALNSARQADIGTNDAVIHLRAGDITYGNYRFDGRFTNKVISLPFAELIIEHESLANNTVFIIGQDDAVNSYLENKYLNVVNVANLTSFTILDRVQKAFFSIDFMSRFKTIYAGRSAFSELSSLLSGNHSISPYNYFDITLVKRKINKYLLDKEQYTDIPKLQMTQAYWCFYNFYGHALSTEDNGVLLAKAMKLDYKNDFYKIVLASIKFKKMAFQEGEQTLREGSTRNQQGCLWRVLGVAPSGEISAINYIYSFESPASVGFEYAAVCFAIIKYHLEGSAVAERYISQSKALSDNTSNTLLIRLREVISRGEN